jgi:hypothetical protein
MRGDYEAFTDPKTRSGYWFKTALIDFLPKVLMYAATIGLFGAYVKRMFDNISEYNKANYNPLPIGIDENGKTLYLPTTSDETGKLFGGIFWKALNVTNHKSLDQGLMDIMQFMAGRIPQIGPALNVAMTTGQYLQGQNPYDIYRGRNIIPTTAYQAGGMYAFVPFIKWEFQQMGGSILLGSSILENTPNQSLFEKVINAPVLSNIAQSIVRVTDYGQTELNNALQNEVIKQEARTRLDNKAMIDEAVKQVHAGSDKRSVLNGLINTVKGDGPMTEDKLKQIKAIQSGFDLAVLKGQNDPNINALIYATSNAQKAAILARIKDSSSADEYNKILHQAVLDQIISADVISRASKL